MGFRDRRASVELTQEAVAEALGIARSTVGMWEVGGSLPHPKLLPRIAKLYRCSIEDLLEDKLDTVKPA